MRLGMKRNPESGFSYIDVMIAMTILLVGILTLAAALTAAYVQTTTGEKQLRAKAIATSTLENVMGARFVSVGGNPYSFDSIQHIGTGVGVFRTGRQPVYLDAGVDGLFGTVDDTGGVDGNFEREIIITDINNPIRPSPPSPITERRITVKVYYSDYSNNTNDRGFKRTESISTSVANF